MQVGYIEQTAGRALGSGRQAASCCIRMISNTATLTDPVDTITTGAETLFRERELLCFSTGDRAQKTATQETGRLKTYRNASN